MKKIINISLISSALVISNMAFADLIQCPSAAAATNLFNQHIAGTTLPEFNTQIGDVAYIGFLSGANNPQGNISTLSLYSQHQTIQCLDTDNQCDLSAHEGFMVSAPTCAYGDKAQMADVVLQPIHADQSFYLYPQNFGNWDFSNPAYINNTIIIKCNNDNGDGCAV